MLVFDISIFRLRPTRRRKVLAIGDGTFLVLPPLFTLSYSSVTMHRKTDTGYLRRFPVYRSFSTGCFL